MVLSRKSKERGISHTADLLLDESSDALTSPTLWGIRAKFKRYLLERMEQVNAEFAIVSNREDLDSRMLRRCSIYRYQLYGAVNG